jgi:hypothetical protein
LSAVIGCAVKVLRRKGNETVPPDVVGRPDDGDTRGAVACVDGL